MGVQFNWDDAVLRGPVDTGGKMYFIPPGPGWLAPFNTVGWTIGVNASSPYCFNLQCATKPTFPLGVTCQVRLVNHRSPKAPPPVELTIRANSFDEKNSALVNIGASYPAHQAANSVLELCVQYGERGWCSTEVYACAAAQHLTRFTSSPLPFDVRLTFPRTGQDLWANSEILKKVSPYFKTQLESGFAESQCSTVTNAGQTAEVDPSPDPGWGDSDADDDDPAAPRPPQTRVYSIKVTAHSYKTYQAVWTWVLTKQLVFTPLRSRSPPPPTPECAQPDAKVTTPSPATQVTATPAVSPKSVYRLAHLLELKVLQDHAFYAFVTNLSVDNVAHELFSSTSEAYEEIRNAAAEYAVRNWYWVERSAGMRAMQAKVEARELGARQQRIV